MLRTDMRSLTDDALGTSEQQPLNLQQRVIKSGLDSLSGTDAKVGFHFAHPYIDLHLPQNISMLFKGLSAFAGKRIS
jgi:hypothetical protein